MVGYFEETKIFQSFDNGYLTTGLREIDNGDVGEMNMGFLGFHDGYLLCWWVCKDHHGLKKTEENRGGCEKNRKRFAYEKLKCGWRVIYIARKLKESEGRGFLVGEREVGLSVKLGEGINKVTI